jgi:hypothetical protein
MHDNPSYLLGKRLARRLYVQLCNYHSKMIQLFHFVAVMVIQLQFSEVDLFWL